MPAPQIFLSSTKVDLGAYRGVAANAILTAGMMPVDMEHFAAEDTGATDVDRREVHACDALVVIVAHCYGSKPADQPEGLSYTWLECRNAIAKGIPIFAFVVDEAYAWTGPRGIAPVSPCIGTSADAARTSARATSLRTTP